MWDVSTPVQHSKVADVSPPKLPDFMKKKLERRDTSQDRSPSYAKGKKGVDSGKFKKPSNTKLIKLAI